MARPFAWVQPFSLSDEAAPGDGDGRVPGRGAAARGNRFWWYASATFGEAEGRRLGLEFLAAYLIEKALSVDNLFVFAMVFSYFAVPARG
ncbi:MAG: hypothetical protein FJX72_22275, partial [Armatimonadetes bacterium]|nr:hypothetical protein [Armatimonadota bacterium]